MELILFVLTFALCSAGETGFMHNFLCSWSETWFVLYIALWTLSDFELYCIWMETVCSEYNADMLKCVCY